MISTYELARLAGVSQSTVSRSLNDRPEISPETKERVRALAKEHGYLEQKRTRRTVLSAKRRAIGVLLQSHHIYKDVFIKDLISVLYNAIEEQNYYAMPLLDINGETGIQRIRDLMGLGLMEGLIILNRVYDPVIDQYFSQIGIPYTYLIFFGRNSSELVNVVDTDNLIGGYIATRHLLELGHRQIVTLTADWSEFEDRTAGYLKALSEYGEAENPAYILHAPDCQYGIGYRLVKEHLHLFERVTALFGQNDRMPIGAMAALTDSGIQVPGQVSVIGYDGVEVGELCRPELTSVMQPLEELCKTAVAKLLEMRVSSSQRKIQAKTFLHPCLIRRKSTDVCRSL